MAANQDIYIVSGARTAIGSFGGSLAALRPVDTGTIVVKEAIARAGAPVLASANPGCALHLAAAGVDARHPMEILDDLLSPPPPPSLPKAGPDGR